MKLASEHDPRVKAIVGEMILNAADQGATPEAAKLQYGKSYLRRAQRFVAVADDADEAIGIVRVREIDFQVMQRHDGLEIKRAAGSPRGSFI